VTITPGNPEAEEIVICSATLTVGQVSLIQEDGLFVFTFAGELEMSAFDEPVPIEELKYSENGDFSLVVSMNMDATFKGVLTFTLTGLQIANGAEGAFWAIEGNLHFAIPNLAIQTGDISIDSAGNVTMDEISIHFEAGAVTVDLHFHWSSEVFEGDGMLRVLPTFEVAAQFRYEDSSTLVHPHHGRCQHSPGTGHGGECGGLAGPRRRELDLRFRRAGSRWPTRTARSGWTSSWR
jgi:hypothetical protein